MKFLACVNRGGAIKSLIPRARYAKGWIPTLSSVTKETIKPFKEIRREFLRGLKLNWNDYTGSGCESNTTGTNFKNEA